MVRDFRLEDEEEYKRFLRIDAETSVKLLNLIKPDIEKQTTYLRKTSWDNKVLSNWLRIFWPSIYVQCLQKRLIENHTRYLGSYSFIKRLKDKYLKVSILLFFKWDVWLTLPTWGSWLSCPLNNISCILSFANSLLRTSSILRKEKAVCFPKASSSSMLSELFLTLESIDIAYL